MDKRLDRIGCSLGVLACWAGLLSVNTVAQAGCEPLSDGLTPGQACPMSVPQVAQSFAVAHQCQLRRDAKLYCWGRNDQGQLGADAPTQRPRSSDLLPVVAGLPALRAVSLGGAHTCALGRDGSVWCWGRNVEGQLGREASKVSSAPLRVSFELLPPTKQARVVSIHAGPRHSCARFSSGRVACWGDLSALGLPNLTRTETPYSVPRAQATALLGRQSLSRSLQQ